MTDIELYKGKALSSKEKEMNENEEEGVKEKEEVEDVIGDEYEKENDIDLSKKVLLVMRIMTVMRTMRW